MGWGGGGLTGTLIDISSLYLRHELSLSSELRHHSETTLHHGVSPLADTNVCQNHLNDNKCKKKLDQIFLSQQIPCSNGAISFPHTTFPEEFVSRPLCVMCIILHEICAPTYGNRRFLVLFILPGCHRHVNGFGVLSFTSLAYRPRSLKKYFPYNQQLGGKKKRHSLKMKTFRLKVSRFFPRLGPFRAIALRIPTCYIYRFTRDRRPTYTN